LGDRELEVLEWSLLLALMMLTRAKGLTTLPLLVFTTEDDYPDFCFRDLPKS